MNKLKRFLFLIGLLGVCSGIVGSEMFYTSAQAGLKKVKRVKENESVRDSVVSRGVQDSLARPVGQEKAKVDLNGDGFTDYLVVREGEFTDGIKRIENAELRTGIQRRRYDSSGMRLSRTERLKAQSLTQSIQPSSAIPILWYGITNGDFTLKEGQWGDALLDDPLTADFDGDGIDDFAVWRAGAGDLDQAYFYSINSSDFTARVEPFGLKYDDPYVVADYDGDGIDDPAVYRCPFLSQGQCYFFYRGTLNNPNRNITYIPFGFAQFGQHLARSGDVDGDGRADFIIQGPDGNNPDHGIFHMMTNVTFNYSAVQWGLYFDLPLTGDFNGDNKTDFAVTRISEDDALWWYVLEKDGGVQIVQWGQLGDFEVPGDYTGDGRTDFAVYRWNDTDATFWVLPSDGSQPFTFSYGQPFDYPIASLFVQF